MHHDILATREAAARQRIRSAAAALAGALGLPPLEAVTPVEQRQRAVAQMRELETIADLLDAAVAATRPQEADHGPKQESRPRSRG